LDGLHWSHGDATERLGRARVNVFVIRAFVKMRETLFGTRQLRRNDRVFFVARRQVLRRLFPAVYMDNNIDYFTISSET
jgi:hypothetical protein